MDLEMLGKNLRRIRQAKKMTQEQVAELSGISRPAYRSIESGESVPKVSTIQQISMALGVKLQELFSPVKTLRYIRFRAQKRMNSREQIINDIASWLDNFNYLENVLNDKLEYKFLELAQSLSSEAPGESRAITAAMKAREVLGLSKGEPIPDIAGLLQLGGIKVFPITLASDGFFGLSVSSNDGGPAVIVNVWERISVERWIFSAAHELGHLLLHLHAYDISETEEIDDQETEANLFAGYFLMPNDAFLTEWSEPYGLSFINRVLKIKRIFKVSYRTVLYRLSMMNSDPSIWAKFNFQYKRLTGRTLDKTEEPEALTPIYFSSPEVFRSQEPDSLSSSDFMEDRLSRLVRLAIEQEKISVSRGAEILRLDLESMRERVNSWV